jgi:hypothetical protein
MQDVDNGLPDKMNESESEDDYVVLDYTACDESIIYLDSSLNEENDTHPEESTPNNTTRTMYSDVVRKQPPRRRDSWRSATRASTPDRYGSPGNQQKESPVHQQLNVHVVHGKGKTVNIKAMTKMKSSQNERQESNRSVSGIFVTRLDPGTTSRQLELHLRKEAGLNTRPEKLNTRHPSYSSFYIPSDRNLRNTLLDASLWPEGARIKLYFS